MSVEQSAVTQDAERIACEVVANWLGAEAGDVSADCLGGRLIREGIEKYAASMPATQADQAPASYQTFKDGKWVECSEFVAKGWGADIAEGCRALYLHPAQTDQDNLPDDVRALVIAGRIVWEGVSFDRIPEPDEIDALDQALSPFAERVPFDDQPDDQIGGAA